MSGSIDGLLRVWNAETGDHLLTVGGPDGDGSRVAVTAAGVDPTGYRLVTGGDDGSVTVWDAGSGQRLKERRSPAGHGAGGRFGVIGLHYCVVDNKRCIIVLKRSNSIVLLSVCVPQ